MAAPTFVIAGGGKSASFASSHTISVNVGTGDDRTVIVEASTYGGASGSIINSITVGGVALTLSGDESLATELGFAGRFRGGALYGATLPTGTQNIVVTASDGNSRISLAVWVASGTTAVSAATKRAGTSTYTPSVTATATSDQSLVFMGVTSAVVGTHTIAATSPGTLRRDEDGWTRLFAIDNVGVGGSTSSGVTISGGATPVTTGHYWVVSGTTPTAELTGTVTLDDITASGSMASAGASTLSGEFVFDSITVSGAMGSNPVTWTVPALTNWNNGLQASVTVPVVSFLRLSDGVQALVLTNQTTNSLGTLTGTTPMLVAGVDYMAVGWNADGSARFARKVTPT